MALPLSARSGNIPFLPHNYARVPVDPLPGSPVSSVPLPSTDEALLAVLTCPARLESPAKRRKVSELSDEDHWDMNDEDIIGVSSYLLF